MKKFVRIASLLVVALMAMTFATTSDAQGGGGGGGGQGGGGGRRGGRGQGGGDPTQMAAGLRQRVTANDDEWKVIEPLLTAVFTKQQAPVLRNARGGGFGGGRGGNGGGGGAAAPAGAPETTALQTATADTAAKNDDIKAKLEALRAAKKKAQDELKTARENLTKVLSVRQEAELVLAGVIE